MSQAPRAYAVIFSSQRTVNDKGYAAMAEEMEKLAATQPGFQGIESVRGADGFGITISYWESRAAIEAWKRNSRHRVAQELGLRKWYDWFRIQIVKVEETRGSADAASSQS